MKRFPVFILIMLIFWGCSGGLDTTTMGPQEHYDYAFAFYNDESYEEALREFESILLQYPGSAVNDDAQYYLGMTYFKREEFLLGAYEFSKLIRDIPASSYVPQAQYMLAESYYQLSPNYQLDQTYSKKAIDEFQAFIEFFPLHERVVEAEKKITELNTKLAQKEYMNAYIYERMSYYLAAIKYYNNVYTTYHDTEYAPMALYGKIKLLIDKERYREALEDIESFLRKFPQNELAGDVESLKKDLQ